MYGIIIRMIRENLDLTVEQMAKLMELASEQLIEIERSKIESNTMITLLNKAIEISGVKGVELMNVLIKAVKEERKLRKS